MLAIKRFWRGVDKTLLVLCVLLSAVSVTALFALGTVHKNVLSGTSVQASDQAEQAAAVPTLSAVDTQSAAEPQSSTAQGAAQSDAEPSHGDDAPAQQAASKTDTNALAKPQKSDDLQDAQAQPESQAKGPDSMRYGAVQLAAALLGIAAALALSAVDYRALAKRWLWFTVPVAALVLLTLLRMGPLGIAPYGTDNYSWIRLPLGFTLQPTELLKICFIITYSLHLQSVRATLNRLRNLLLLLAHMALPVLVVHFQGDDGTALVFIAIGFVMLFAAGLSRIILACILAGGIAGGAVLWVTGYFKSYQMQRIAALFNPSDPKYADIIYQQACGRQALGNGGWLGQGLLGGEYTYVPLQRNDFIFTFIGEAMGFVGAAAVVLLFTALLARILWVGRSSADLLGGLICVGVFSTLAWQIVVNLGMNLMLGPVIGITLPFLSAGGTSVVSVYLSMGLVASVHRVSRAQPQGALQPAAQ